MTKTTPWRDVRRKLDPAREARVATIKRAMEDAIALAQLRELFGLRQVELAERLGTNQASVSRLERREDLFLSTLREYVAALGGSLELTASFPDGQRVQLAPGFGTDSSITLGEADRAQAAKGMSIGR
jgi:transcriptional regulator with XRE-family HTH domain